MFFQINFCFWGENFIKKEVFYSLLSCTTVTAFLWETTTWTRWNIKCFIHLFVFSSPFDKDDWRKIFFLCFFLLLKNNKICHNRAAHSGYAENIRRCYTINLRLQLLNGQLSTSIDFKVIARINLYSEAITRSSVCGAIERSSLVFASSSGVRFRLNWIEMKKM